MKLIKGPDLEQETFKYLLKAWFAGPMPDARAIPFNSISWVSWRSFRMSGAGTELPVNKKATICSKVVEMPRIMATSTWVAWTAWSWSGSVTWPTSDLLRTSNWVPWAMTISSIIRQQCLSWPFISSTLASIRNSILDKIPPCNFKASVLRCNVLSEGNGNPSFSKELYSLPPVQNLRKKIAYISTM